MSTPTRAWLDFPGPWPSVSARLSVAVLSYNVLAQLFIKRELYPFASKNALRWGHRQKQLLSEILASQADIIALQEVDNYKTFWQPKLFAAGYDVVHLSKDGHPSRAGSQKSKGSMH
jgi:mRNA deadenylase 3'-5' endonuclease subunit Ccr4